MPTRTLTFSTYSDTLAPGSGDPWGPANSTPAFPSGYTLGGDPPRISSGNLTKYSGTGNTVILDNTVLSGNVIACEAVLAGVGSDSQFLAICSPAGTGYQFLINSTNIRCFSMTAFVLGSQVGSSISFVATTGHTCRVERDNTSGVMTVYTQGVSRGSVTQSNANTDWRAGVGTRNAAQISSLTSIYTASQSIDTFTSPIVPGASASGTQTGYVDGAITADFEGITFTGTVSGGNVSGTVAGFVDGGLCPLLPATGVTCTFTQSGNNASITRDLSTPTGLQELRDGGGTPANFSGIVLGDPKYIGQSFADAGNPLTTLDRSYVDPSYGLTIDQDGRVRLNATDHPTDPVPSLPYTTTLWIRRGSDGKAYSHTLTIDEEGNVSTGGLSVAGLSNSGLSNAGLSVSGL